MTPFSTSFAFTSRSRALACASLRGAMHCGWNAGIAIDGVGNLIL